MSSKSGVPAYPFLKLRGKGAARRSTLGTRKPLPPIYDAADFSPHDPDPRLGAGLTDPAKPAPARAVPASNGSVPGPRNSYERTVETKDAERREQSRLTARAMRDTGADLLYHSGNDDLQKIGVRLSHCCKVPHGQGPVQLMQGADGAAYISGTKRCNGIWTCETCSRRISSGRRDDLNTALANARALGLSPVLVTLTASHTKADRLGGPDGLLQSMKASKKRLQQLQPYRLLKPVLAGSVTTTEVTFGGNGWHVHYHCIFFFRLDPAAALAAAETLRPAWLKALSAYGMTGNHAAFRADPGHMAGDYVTKGSWGAGEELSLSDRKVGRGSSRNPWQLLRDAAAGDKAAAALWLTFASAFRSVRQLVWSRGLRDLLGVGVEPDADAIADPAEVAEPVVLRVWQCDPVTGWERWKGARRRYCSLLTAAERGFCLDAAEFGATDRAKWDRYLSESVLLE